VIGLTAAGKCWTEDPDIGEEIVSYSKFVIRELYYTESDLA
jgi:hypothetical protein